MSIVLIGLAIILGSFLLAVIVAGISFLLDPSPTSDDECRGGHDF